MKRNTFWIRFLWSLVIVLFWSSAGAQIPEKVNWKELPTQERYEYFAKWHRLLHKSNQACPIDHDILKETIINGNQIRVLVTNQGSISTPTADNANADLVWPSGPDGLGYAFEFGPIVGANVVDANGDTIQVVSDGFFAGSGGEFDPLTGDRWGWEPRKGFSDPNSNEVATFSDLDRDQDGKPDSWPERWFNEALGRYVWPAFLGDDATTPDEEVFYVMDDFCNYEFQYYPSPSDSSIRGLGLELQVRIFQFNNASAEDLIFLVYTITNVGEKELNDVFLGMFGDPHVGGPNDFSDDNAGFISPFDEDFEFNTRNMLFAFDADGTGDGGKKTGYFGYRFLESPGIETDNFDNDADSLIDESPFNDAGVFIFGDIGIYGPDKEHWSGDEDGDWNPEFDDVGVDGIADTRDFGEGDGKPNQIFFLDLNNNGFREEGEPTSEFRQPGMRFGGGEPNFGFLDIAESDQLGLTSFNAILFGGNNDPSNDPLMWDLISTPNQREGDPPPNIEQEADNVFIYGSGPFSLAPGESQRFSIALLLGEDFEDLLLNAAISQQVFESDYRFAQAPRKPTLTAVPGDGKVTLYWDAESEKSFDPFVARANPDDPDAGFDFEGYLIYRSRDESFNDTKIITDSRGNAVLSRPLTFFNERGLEFPARFDVINEYQGLSEVEVANRGVRFELGDNTGLVHSFVDSNNVRNGVTYFYAVTAYDHGDVNAGVSPTETTREIKRDATDRLFAFDINTAAAVPGPPAAGFVGPDLNTGSGNMAAHVDGDATGIVSLEFLDALLVKDNQTYDIVFDSIRTEPGNPIGYSVVDLEERSLAFVSRDTLFANLGVGIPLAAGSVTVRDQAGSVVDPAIYELLLESGRIRSATQGSLPRGNEFTITFKTAPVFNSLSLNGEDDNPVFDGIRVFVNGDETQLDSLSTAGGRSGFKMIETNTNFSDEFTEIGLANVGSPEPFADDFEVRFTDYDTSATGELISPADSAILTNVKTNFRIVRVSTGERVDFFIQEVAGLRNGRWDWQESVVLIRPNSDRVTETTYLFKFNPPSDTLVSSSGDRDSVVVQPAIYPGDGDVFLLFSQKAFDLEDRFTFTTKSAAFNSQQAENALDDIIVVPNPYIAFSGSEIAGVRTGDRDDRDLQFRNLPQKCTIRIYTITGELVDTIEKDDSSSLARWNLLSFESQSIAYGVYIYHVDAPGIGTKIGRFGVIK